MIQSSLKTIKSMKNRPIEGLKYKNRGLKTKNKTNMSKKKLKK